MTAAETDNVRQLRGTARKDRTTKRPNPVAGTPTPPTWLPAEGKREWKRVSPELERLGMLALVDRGILTLYCDAWAKWVDAAKQLSDEGLLAEGQKHVDRKHPAWQIYREAGATAAMLGGKLGLNYSDRSKMHAPEGEEPDGSGVLD